MLSDRPYIADDRTEELLHDKIARLERENAELRNATLEEAAMVCESEYDNWDNERPLRLCANAIRIRKS